MDADSESGVDWRILHERARRHSWRGEGWLSIKTFAGGRAHYSVGPGHHAVDDRSYLILNHGQSYGIEIDSPQPIESFCIFFAPGFAAETFHSLFHSDGQLLDEPLPSSSSPVVFFQKIYPHDDTLSPALRRLRQTHTIANKGRVEELMQSLLAALLKAQDSALRESDNLLSLRAATRHELYRRVSRARDYVDAMFAEPLSLKGIARVASLSPNHFLRSFTQLYRKTPHQFLMTRRLSEAARLLTKTDLPVTEICFAVGFESLGSFSSLFSRRFGIAPSAYRHRKK